jgi:hypothetical protein
LAINTFSNIGGGSLFSRNGREVRHEIRRLT